MIKAVIELLSPCLGNERTSQPNKRFLPKLPNNNLDSNLAFWRWAIRNACKEAEYSDYSDNIKFKPTASYNKTGSFTISKKSTNIEGKEITKSEWFETIPQKETISFFISLTDSINSTTNPPNENQLYNILSLIGELYGFSYYGNSLGYGRYKILTLDKFNPIIDSQFNKNELQNKLEL